MKTFIKVSLSSAIVTTALFLPIPSFAQSWKQSWDDNDSWDASPSTSKPSSQTPSSANTNTQSNSDDDSWDASPSIPKPARPTPKADYDSWDVSPSTPKPARPTPKADYDSWDVSPSTSTSSSGAYAQTSNTNSSYTDAELRDSNFVIRIGGGFTYLYYGSIGAANGSKHRAFHYPGANGNLAFNYCMNSHCIGVDQILATVYTYKDSDNHFLGSTHINYINHHLLADRFMLGFGVGAGLTYASNSNYKEKRVFAGNGLAISFKLYCIFTYFITRNIGIGVNVAPLGLIELGLNNPEGSSIKHLPGSVGLDAGLHVMLKY